MSTLVFADSDSFFYTTIFKEVFPEFLRIYCSEFTDDINTSYIYCLESVASINTPVDILIIEQNFLQRMVMAGLKIDARRTLLIGYDGPEVNKDDIFRLFFKKMNERPSQTSLGA